MEALIEEGSEMTEEDSEGAVLDAGLIGAAQRVERNRRLAELPAVFPKCWESEHVFLARSDAR